MNDYEVDVSVLLVFFIREDTLQRVFEAIRKAKPSRLFLYQDGPREGVPEDLIHIQNCRKIVENIDWNCEVNRLYQDKNYGPDYSGYLADTWAFSLTDKCIILEDDTLPSISFFRFCKEILDKYEFDEDIMLISGMNYEEKSTNIPFDYFFSCTTFTWGWATWKRVVDNWDSTYSFLNDDKKVCCLQNYINQKKLLKNWINVYRKHSLDEYPHFESVLTSCQNLKRGLTVVPTLNLVNNIGLTENSSHYASNIKYIPRAERKLFTMQRYELDFPLVHNNLKEDNMKYKKSAYKLVGWNHKCLKIKRIAETYFYYLLDGKFDIVISDFKKKIANLKDGTVSS